jgi:hypothetical protein
MSNARTAVIPTQTENPLAGLSRAPSKRTAIPFGRHCRRVDYDHVSAYRDLFDQQILCRDGQIWITIENDPQDHAVRKSEAFNVGRHGKVVIAGKGCFTILADPSEPAREGSDCGCGSSRCC